MTDSFDFSQYNDNPEAVRLLSSLNDQQKKAVVANGKPLVVFAGAGSGKTRVITTKIVWCIKILGIPSWKILAVTFTNKACNEMKDRIQKMLPETNPKDLCIKTFHSFGAMVLHRFGDRIGLNSSFKIYDEDDSLALLAQIFPSDKRSDLSPYAKKISLLKDKMISPEQVRIGKDPELYKYYSRYEEALRHTGNVDFADLILRTIELIDKDREVQQWLHNRFKVVLVDEYQDSNAAQCELLKRVAGPDCFVCVVGDDDQSIYKFRGADVHNILSFGEYFPGAQVIKLEQNYRSTSSIIALAASVIGLNKARAPKKIWTAREEGRIPELTYVDSDYSEAYYIATILQRDGKYDSSAVLYRTNAQSATFESTFNKLRIPYRLVGALRFYEREEVKDVIAHVALLLNPRDSVSFQRIVNKPLRGIGPTSMTAILEASDNYGGDLLVTCRNILNGTDATRISGTKGLQAFVVAYEKVLAMIGTTDNSEVARSIVSEFGIQAYYKDRDTKEKNIDNKREKNIEQIVNIIAEQESYRDGIEGLSAFMEEAALDPAQMATDQARSQTGVTLITMHNTKGLEFDRVFISGMEEGIFPSSRSETEDDLEEERRLFYVAITRARNELYIFSCSQRRMWGRTQFQIPSQFLDEIPKDLIKVNSNKNGAIDGTTSGFAKKSFDFSPQKSFDFSPRKTFDFNQSSYHPTPKPKTPSALLSRFNPSPYRGPSYASVKSAPAAAPSDSSEQPMFEGDIVSNSTYGQGSITSVRDFGKKKIYDVKFDDGRRASFVAGKGSIRKI
ncbi:MAG: UvrD-helicase domain-containing protein [Sphaerochaetaceae bacterium]